MSTAEVRYRPVAHDGPHTMEQQLLLVTLAAYRAWDAWSGSDAKVQGVSEALDTAMRLLYAQCYQTDVFMGGVDHVRQNKTI